MCKKSECIKNSTKLCYFCNKKCNNDACFHEHIRICKKKKMDDSRNKNKYCSYCSKSVDNDHLCFLDSLLSKNKNIDEFVFFDYESTQEKEDLFRHKPNLIIAFIYKRENNIFCFDKEIIFYDNINFCQWLFKGSQNRTAIAHNSKGYDSIFIMNYLLNNEVFIADTKPNIILQGNKPLCIYYKKTKIIDSMAFIPTPLAEFSKIFSINENKKGFFPYLFNKRENWNYNGPIPEKKYFCPEKMSIERKKEFEKWYNSKIQSSEIFDFKKEIITYCRSDVDLLSRGCLKFRDIILDVTNNDIDPFQHCLTIASVCNMIYRKIFMPPNSIARIPKLGYNPLASASKKAIGWLKYNELIKKTKIKHALNGGEEIFFYKDKKFKVDGFDKENKTIYEFDGCIFHGCNICFAPFNRSPITGEYFNVIRKRHDERLKQLKQFVIENNYKFKQIRECEWDKEQTNKKDIVDFLKKIKFTAPIHAREALCGARVNCGQLYYKVSKGYKIKNYDFNSLYPSVMMYNSFPIGHPKIITENFAKVTEYFGLIKCSILPPSNLLFPVLPIKHNGKLIFPLCNSCMIQKSEKCIHIDSERIIEGVFCSPEISKAIERGYKIIDLFEVWHFQKDTESPIFSNYVKKFFKIKQEASGKPKWVKNEEDLECYINQYKNGMNITIEKDKIDKNPGLRRISKLMLNSLWGRFAMNTNKKKMKIVTNLIEWINIIGDPNYIISDIICSKNAVQVYYTEESRLFTPSKQTNEVIAAFTTCYARLKLLDELEKIGQRVLYYDTDSIIFYYKEGDYVPKLGDLLGELTDESPEYEIIEFVSCGPKNYAFRKENGETKCVIKGFTLDYNTSDHINMEKLIEIVFSDRTKKIKVPQNVIKRDIKTWNLFSVSFDKIYSFICDKMIINDDFTTKPFGFKK